MLALVVIGIVGVLLVLMFIGLLRMEYGAAKHNNERDE